MQTSSRRLLANIILRRNSTFFKVISYGNPVLKTENRGFNTFAGVFDPGNGRTRPAFLEILPAFSGEASNAACHQFEKLSTHSSFLKISFGRDLLKKQGPFSDETSIHSWKCLLVFFLRKWQHRKKIERCRRREQERVDTSHRRITSTLRRTSPIRFDSGCKTRENT